MQLDLDNRSVDDSVHQPVGLAVGHQTVLRPAYGEDHGRIGHQVVDVRFVERRRINPLHDDLAHVETNGRAVLIGDLRKIGLRRRRIAGRRHKRQSQDEPGRNPRRNPWRNPSSNGQTG
jgi:hypothetical protein